MTPKPVTAVVVTYQSARTIAKALAAARRCHEAQLLDAVIVDNNSTDATREILACEATWARVVLSDRNNGFARGCNIGLEHVSSPYTLFLNPDSVLEPDALRAMLEFLEARPAAGIVGPATICGGGDKEAVLQHTGLCPTPWTVLWNALPLVPRRSISWDIEPGAAPRRTGWVCGAVLLARTSLIRRLEGFDSRFFLYWEEMDLCKRAEAEGFEIWALGTALARHVVAASSSPHGARVGASLARHYFQSRYYYMVKHHGRLAATLADLGEFALVVLRSFADAARGRPMYRLYARLQAAPLTMPQRAPNDR